MIPARTGRALPRLPGTAPDAHRRNALVILAYLFALVLLVGVVVALV